MSLQGILRIASRIESSHPVLAYDLEQSVLALSGGRTAVVNPGVQKFEERIESMVALLKSVRQDLKSALEDHETAEEFAKFFKEGALDEEFLQFQKMSDRASGRAASVSVAGPMDWLDKLRGKKKKDPEPEDSGMTPSYRMDDSSMDEFVEGNRDWADPSQYLERETKENQEFVDGAKDVMKAFKDAKNSPDKSAVQNLLGKVEELIKRGGNVLKGAYEHLKEPSRKVDLSEEGPKKPASGKKIFNLEGTVDHYVDMLKESAGDEKKVVSLLKELFNAVSPALEDERASLASARLASVFIRTAHAHPGLRPGLVPLIRKAVASF